MKTITVKLPEREAEELDLFVRGSGLSKSEFIRHLLIQKIGLDRKEKLGWMMIAEKALAKRWDNPKDNKVWSKYLEND
ncbi:CopG family transcriptional regulator [Candidatus Pacearchaeota archaeon]|nr:CopG family transcriptional regulator [Candidatus Pacearchaeota archaeon]